MYFVLLSLQDEGVVMGAARWDGAGSAGLPDSGAVVGEPVHEDSAGMRLHKMGPVGLTVVIIIVVTFYGGLSLWA